MKKKPFLITIVLLLTAALFLSACSSKTGSESPGGTKGSGKGSKVKQTVMLTATAEIPTMDSTRAHDGVAFTVLNNVNEGLFRQDENNKPEKALVEDYKVSDDKLTYTFTLRKSKWSNGDPVTAKDFEYAWKKVMREASEYNFMVETAGIKNASAIMNEEKDADELGVKAIDEQTLEVTLDQPSPLLESLLTFPTFLPQNEAFVEQQGDQYALEVDNLLYNGPFKLVEWKHDQGWKYVKNPDYWDAGNVKMEEINVRVVKEATTGVNLYETKGLDRAGLTATYVNEFKTRPDFITNKQAGTGFLRLNHNNEILKNKNIRKAIGMAIDREGLTSVILNDGSQPLYGIVPEGFFKNSKSEDFREANGDFNKGTPEQAKELWEQGLKELGKKGGELSLNTSDAESSKQIAENLKGTLESALPGFKLQIKSVPFKQRLEIEKAITYDISLSTWGPDYSDPMTYIDMWIKGSSANRMDYHNEKYDELVHAAKNETDLDKRFQMMLDAEKILLEEDVALVPLYQSGEAILQRPSIKKLVKHPTGADFTFKWMYRDKE